MSLDTTKMFEFLGAFRGIKHRRKAAISIWKVKCIEDYLQMHKRSSNGRKITVHMT